LPRNAIIQNKKYALKAAYYWLCGLFYIYACLMFCFTIYFLMMSRFAKGSGAVNFSYVIDGICIFFTAISLKTYLDGFDDIDSQ
jgi:hypothetical protein